jgi:capsular polysaccharide biosynthesis protein
MVTNRAQIEQLAFSYGFELIRPGAMTAEQQIISFRSADQVIGEYGSALHNTIFGAPGAICVAVRGRSSAPGFIQSSIGAAFGQETAYVFGAAREPTDESIFEIAETDFRLALSYIMLRYRLEWQPGNQIDWVGL